MTAEKRVAEKATTGKTDAEQEIYFRETCYLVGKTEVDRENLDRKMEKLLERNRGVGIIGGLYEEGLPIRMISLLAVQRLGYADLAEFLSGTGGNLKVCVEEEESIFGTPESFRAFSGVEEVRLCTSTGEKRWFRIVKEELEAIQEQMPKQTELAGRKTEPERVPMWMMSVCDIDEVRNREMALIRAKEEAERANASKSEFFSRVSHDIRTPLNGIIGMARIAGEQSEDAQLVREKMEKLEQAGRQLEKLLNDVLDISKLESGNMEKAEEPFHLRTLLAEAGTLVLPGIEEKQIKVLGKHFLETHDEVIGSPMHIRRIIENILSNAVKYNKPGGTLESWLEEIPVDETHSIYRFTVQDTGVGMSKEFQRRLFDPFTRERRKTGEAIEGTGLGMAILKEFVELLDGTVRVESEEEKGTTFIVEIPLELNLAKESPGDDKAEERVDLKGVRVLLVEDNPLNREIAEYFLEQLQMECVTVGNGKEAVQAVQKDPEGFAVILMDLQMPEMDGYEAAREIRKLEQSGEGVKKRTPIIALSANAFTEDAEKCKAAGMEDHLAKPIDKEALIRMLKRYAGKCEKNKNSAMDTKDKLF